MDKILHDCNPVLTLCKLQIWWGYDQYNCFYGTKNDLNENNSTIWLKNTLDKLCCSIGHVSLQTARSPQEWPWVNIQPTLKFSWTSNCSVGRTADTLRTTLPWHESGAVDRIIMSDDKLFIIQEELKAQNDSVYVATIKDIPQQIEGLQRFEILRIVMICENDPYQWFLPNSMETPVLCTTWRQYLSVAGKVGSNVSSERTNRHFNSNQPGPMGQKQSTRDFGLAFRVWAPSR